MQTSATQIISGSASLRARNAVQTGPFGSHAAVPSASFLSGIPKRMRERTPAFQAMRASSTRLSTESCATPGIDAIGLRTPLPETANKGSMKSPGESRVSRTRPRSVSVRRSRRGRWTGKVIRFSTVTPGPAPLKASAVGAGGPDGLQHPARNQPGGVAARLQQRPHLGGGNLGQGHRGLRVATPPYSDDPGELLDADRKSTRLNSSHLV